MVPLIRAWSSWLTPPSSGLRGSSRTLSLPAAGLATDRSLTA